MTRIKALFDRGHTDPNWLSALRIGVACTLIIKILAEFKQAYLIYGMQGVVQGVITEKITHPLTPAFYHVYTLFSEIIAEDLFINLFFGLYILLAILLGIGWQTRFMAVACWFFHILLFNNSPLTTYGVDSFLLSLLFYCSIFPVHLTWSFDFWRKKSSFDPERLRNYQFFLQVHLCIVYLIAGVTKLAGETWQNGEAIWYAVNQPQFYSAFTPTLIDFFSQYPIILHGLTWGTLAIEIGYGIFIWIKKTRAFFFISIILMHMFIGVVMQLYLFALIMIVFNIAAFGPAVLNDIRSILPKLRVRAASVIPIATMLALFTMSTLPLRAAAEQPNIYHTPPIKVEVDVELGRKKAGCQGVGICTLQPGRRGLSNTGGVITIVKQGNIYLIEALSILKIPKEAEILQFYRDGKMNSTFPVEEDIPMNLDINGKQATVTLRSGIYKVSKVQGGYILSR